MVNTFVCLVASFVLFLGGCNSGISDKNLSYISPEEASVALQNDGFNLLGAKKPTVIVDPRQKPIYSKEHISGAMSLPYGWLNLHIWRLDDLGTIIVAGETYNDSVSMAMSKSLLDLGFTDVKTLRGGIEAWKDSGKPVITKE